MLKDVQPIAPDGEPYATVEELTTVNDMPQRDVKVTRWFASGRALKLRVRGPNLDEQDAIHQAALTKNKKTGEWQEHRPTFCAETLQRCVVMPQLDTGQAQVMRKKNPVIISALVDLIWALPVFSDDELEKLALDMAPPPDPDAPTPADAGDNEGQE
jgi:hypothetical protein